MFPTDPLHIGQIEDTVVSALRSFFRKCGHSEAVLGLSGGIDSAVTAVLAVKALGKENVTGILMPSDFSTLHSVNDAVDLADNLGIRYLILPIGDIYDRFIKGLEPVFAGDHSWDVTQENIQARIRGTLLMAYSNRKKALVLNTSNKSELSVGYGTLYGDLAGAVMVLADIYKLQVYQMARLANMEKEIIPASTINKAPSAELRENQKDSDSLPDYGTLDPLLYALNEEGRTREDMVASGTDAGIVDRVIGLKAAAAFKVLQMPPVIKVSEKPLLGPEKWITS
ncbi:MAG TPA: NAD(+) synthase [Candidatus Coprenecus stercoripullorum]|nr:NAD(+) synthase [Candidatus Coprenecus stercoripullorum]